jgi:hypothetical protein
VAEAADSPRSPARELRRVARNAIAAERLGTLPGRAPRLATVAEVEAKEEVTARQAPLVVEDKVLKPGELYFHLSCT